MNHLAHSVLIEGYGDYRICPCGTVISMKRGIARQLVSFPRDKTGYLAVNLCADGRMRTVSVHLLVAAAFLAAPMKGQNCVLHEDDNPRNPGAKNLKRGTNAENSAQMVERSRQARGQKIGISKLTPAKVRKIRRLAPTSKQYLLAKRFRVSTSTLNSIVLRRTWRHI